MAEDKTKQVDVKDADPTEDDVKCDNHPQRKGATYTGNGAFEIHLCDECTPSWFKDDE